jgi:hypothetical protein
VGEGVWRGEGGFGTLEEDVAGFWVGGDALEKGEGIAHAIRCRRTQLGGIQQRIHTDNLLQQRRHDPYNTNT